MKMMKAAVALGMALTMTVTGASAVFAEGEPLSVATDFEVKTLVPWAASEENAFMVLNQAEEGLFRMDENNQPQPALCDTYEVSDDKLTYTFHLRDGIQWSNGEPVTAEDVVFSYQMYSDPSVEAKSRYHLEYIAGVDDSGAELSEDSIEVTADSDYEVTFKLKEAMYPDTFLQDIDTVFIIPKHIFEGKTAEEINAPDLWANPVGSGPFIYDSEINGERMEFTKNENYYLGTPNIDRLIIRVVPSANVLSGLMNGELDLIGFGSVLTDDWETAKSQDNLVTESVPTTSYTTLIFNTQKEYLTQEVRQALNMAINRDVLVNGLLMGEGTPIMTPIAPVSPYYNDKVQVQYDPEKAKEMLAEAGFPAGQTLKFFISSGSSITERCAALIVQDFANVGVQVQIEQMDFATLMSRMLDGEHDLGIIGSGGTLDPSESREMIYPGSSCNFCQLQDTELSDLIDKGNAELTFETRKPYFDEYQEKVVEKAAMGYLYTKNFLTAYNKSMKNLNVADFNGLNWSSWEWDKE